VGTSHYFAATLAVLTLALPARAAEPVSPARALFNEARALASKGDYAAACPKFEQSLALEVGLGTQFNLADCWEHQGRTASAQALFLGAAASAKAAGQTEREQVLRERAVALEPRIAKLVIEVDASDPKLVVKRDQLPIEADSWGKAIALDPGTYTISAKAPGKKPWRKTVEIKAGSSVVTTIVPDLEAKDAKGAPEAAKPAPEAPVKTEPKRAPSAPAPASNRENDRHAPNYKALSLGALGLTAAGFGTFMAIRYKSANDDAQAICPTSLNCSASEIAAHDQAVDRAISARTLTYVGFGVGAASLVGAAALFLLEPSRPSRPAAFRAAPQLGEAGVYGAMVNGSF
jgi:tetratricopeptide (TPR) repeat protein